LTGSNRVFGFFHKAKMPLSLTAARLSGKGETVSPPGGRRVSNGEIFDDSGHGGSVPVDHWDCDLISAQMSVFRGFLVKETYSCMHVVPGILWTLCPGFVSGWLIDLQPGEVVIWNT
jgi:hypothetical protein